MDPAPSHRSFTWGRCLPAGIAYGNGRFVSVWGQWGSTSSTGSIYTSTNGLQWTRAGSDPLVVLPFDLAFGEAGFVLLDGNRILTSSDGVAWQVRHQLEASWGWRSLAYAGNRIVCLAGQYSGLSSTDPIRALTSEDGIS